MLIFPDLHGFQVMHPIYPRTLWITVSVVVFVVSWTFTGGGYSCSIPLALLMLTYVAVTTLHTKSKVGVFEAAVSMSREKVKYLLRAEKRSMALLISYWCFDTIATFWFPYVERSNGAPYSLIFFSVAFISLFILPTVLWLLLLPVSLLLKWESGLLQGEKSKAAILDVLIIVWNQRLTVLSISVVVLVMFVFDADLTCVIRYTMKGNPCWPVLVPAASPSQIPYPLQHTWIKSWHKLYHGYSPGAVQLFIQNLGRGLGEVPTLLPAVIGVYVVSLLIVPSRHRILRVTAFACVAGIVLGGVFSATLKILLHRYRPNAYGDPYKWTGPGTAVVNHLAFSKLDLSFPAGHTTVTSAVSTSLYLGLLQSHEDPPLMWRAFVVLLLYLFPVAVLISRVGDCYHWNSDATFGVSHPNDSSNTHLTNLLFFPFPVIHSLHSLPCRYCWVVLLD